MQDLLNFGQMLACHARLAPNRIGARDLDRSMTFAQWNARSCRLANALLGLGLAKGDRVAILAYNCVEWVEIYAAMAKAGLVAVPVNFRLVAAEARYVLENAGASALIVEDELAGIVEELRNDMPVARDRLIHFGKSPCPAGYRSYEDLLAAASDRKPGQHVATADPWMLMYTSGTTGRPKGAIRSHRGGALLSLVTQVELGIHRNDDASPIFPAKSGTTGAAPSKSWHLPPRRCRRCWRPQATACRRSTGHGRQNCAPAMSSGPASCRSQWQLRHPAPTGSCIPTASSRRCRTPWAARRLSSPTAAISSASPASG